MCVRVHTQQVRTRSQKTYPIAISACKSCRLQRIPKGGAVAAAGEGFQQKHTASPPPRTQLPHTHTRPRKNHHTSASACPY
jgi:hypothetical protein